MGTKLIMLFILLLLIQGCGNYVASLKLCDIRGNVISAESGQNPKIFVLDDGMSCSLCLKALNKAFEETDRRIKVFFLLSRPEGIVGRVEYINELKRKIKADGYYFCTAPT